MSEPRAYRQRRSAVDALAKLYEGHNQPVSAMLEIADRCNESCLHCYQVQGQKGELSTDALKSAMDELQRLGVLLLTLSGGEPTLRRDFLELVRYARQCKFAVKIYSNGLNITRDVAQQLGDMAVQEVQLSLYSTNSEVHDKVTRVPGSHAKTVSAVKFLRAAGVKVVVKTPLMDINQDDVSRYVELAQSLGADYSVDPKLSPREDGALTPLALETDKEAYLALRRQPAFAKTRGTLTPPPAESNPCGACQGSLHMEANGELRPCSMWSVPTGQVTEEGLTDAWQNNPVARSIRQLTWAHLVSCRECDLRGACSRCYADAFKYVGNALAPYRQACRGTLWTYEVRTGVAPRIVAEKGASSQLGPFRRVGEHSFVSHTVCPTQEDLERLDALPFLRQSVPQDQCEELPGPHATSAQLLQLGRGPKRTLTRPASGPSPNVEAPASEG